MKEQEWLVKIKTMLKQITKIDYEKVRLSVCLCVYSVCAPGLHVSIYTITL